VLIAPAIVTLSIGADASAPIRYGIAVVAFVIVVGAVAVAKSRDLAIGGDEIDPDVPATEDDPAPAQV
jgi:K(+)-stimulated pyrophosphate-energized sodium pump